jgi:hypothetical protein
MTIIKIFFPISLFFKLKKQEEHPESSSLAGYYNLNYFSFFVKRIGNV